MLLPCGGAESVCRGATELFPSLVMLRALCHPSRSLLIVLTASIYTLQVAGGKVRLMYQVFDLVNTSICLSDAKTK